MAYDYSSIATKVNAALARVGLKIEVQRLASGAFTKVASGYGVFVEDAQENEGQSSSSVLASTVIRKRKLMLSPSVKTIQVNDQLIANKVTYTVTAVSAIEPTSTTLGWEVEVS
jgi:hypothetical protein